MSTPHGNKEQNDKKSSEPFDAGEKQQEKKENSQLKENTSASDKPNPQHSEPEQSSPTRESHEQPERQNFELPQTTSLYQGQLNQQQDQTRQSTQSYFPQPSSKNSNQPAQTNPQNVSQPWKSNQQYLSQLGQPQQQYPLQPRPRYPLNSNQPAQTNPQNVSQPWKSNQQYLSQLGQPQQQYPLQPRPRYPLNSPQSGQSQYYPQPAQPYPPPYPPQPGQYVPNQYAPQARQTYQQYPSQPDQYTAPPMQYQQVYYDPNQQNLQRTVMIHASTQPQSAQDTPMARPGRRPNDTEPEMEDWSGFQDSKVRGAFVRKVYIILTLQLLFTMGVIALFIFEHHVKEFIRKNVYLYYVSSAVFLAVYIGMACFQDLRRSFPSNLICLFVFTLSMSCMLGIISRKPNLLLDQVKKFKIFLAFTGSSFAGIIFHKTEAVLMAAGICAAVCFLVTVFSFCPKFDFTSCGAVLCILMLVLVMFGLIAIFIPSKIMTLIYAGTGATVFTLFLAYDTQMLMGGKTIEISPEEYIFAAVQIYLDVAFIFLFILTIITYCSE